MSYNTLLVVRDSLQKVKASQLLVDLIRESPLVCAYCMAWYLFKLIWPSKSVADSTSGKKLRTWWNTPLSTGPELQESMRELLWAFADESRRVDLLSKSPSVKVLVSCDACSERRFIFVVLNIKPTSTPLHGNRL